MFIYTEHTKLLLKHKLIEKDLKVLLTDGCADGRPHPAVGVGAVPGKMRHHVQSQKTRRRSHQILSGVTVVLHGTNSTRTWCESHTSAAMQRAEGESIPLSRDSQRSPTS